MHIEEHASLHALNTFRVEARARYLLDIRSETDALDAARDPRFAGLPRLYLGGGSNLLFIDDYPGVVWRITLRGIERVGEDAEATFVRAAAGERWHDFVRWSVEQGYWGLENLSLIPGTVGAAPVQNIGAYGVDIAAVCAGVDTLDPDSGQRRHFSAQECRFGYRDSVFRQHARGLLITAVTFRLPKHGEPRIDYPGVREALGDVPVTPLSISDAIIRVRGGKLPGTDTEAPGSAGSFFKNPVVDEERAAALLVTHPGLPHWPAGAGRVKLSAAWLIEQAGLKGYRDGDAGVYARHALVLINHGAARGADIWRVALHVRDTVERCYGLRLEPEPSVLPG